MQRGAWNQFYRNPMTGHDDDEGWAILSLKRELAYNGYPDGMKLSTQTFGKGAEQATKEFQQAHPDCGPADGIIGPKTAMVLWRKQKLEVERKNGIPDHWLAKQITHESANDPAARGYIDQNDRGLDQISKIHHPEVSDKQAFTASFSIPWHGEMLYEAAAIFLDWEVAVVSWNVGIGGARVWLELGKPQTRGGLTSPAWIYLQQVKNAAW
jgi:soluble lytic murein transglycosylase-like protein